jgi:DNA-binding transcriptional MocR family regulator
MTNSTETILEWLLSHADKSFKQRDIAQDTAVARSRISEKLRDYRNKGYVVNEGHYWSVENVTAIVREYTKSKADDQPRDSLLVPVARIKRYVDSLAILETGVIGEELRKESDTLLHDLRRELEASLENINYLRNYQYHKRSAKRNRLASAWQRNVRHGYTVWDNFCSGLKLMKYTPEFLENINDYPWKEDYWIPQNELTLAALELAEKADE